jgi:hypothetical protein
MSIKLVEDEIQPDFLRSESHQIVQREKAKGQGAESLPPQGGGIRPGV